MVLNILSGIVLLLLMVFASGVVADIVERFAFQGAVKKKKLAAMLVGFSLALPELFVGIASALAGKTEIAFGNIVGANLANLSLVIGGLAVAVGTVPVVGEYLQKDLWITVGLAMLPFLMLTDGTISLVEGVILVILYFGYELFWSSEKNLSTKEVKKKPIKKEGWLAVVVLILGLIILSSSAWLLIQIGIKIAVAWKVSMYWVGLVLIAFGTTLPELFLLAVQKKQKAALMLPKLLGSVVMNSTLVIGLVAMMQEITLNAPFQRGLSGIFLVFILGLFWLFTKSKKKLEKWEGVVLIGVYLMFLGVQMIFA